MTETQRRIRAYKKALPELRERVIAVALLLAMSASMLGSASFAWITLSTAPEVSGMATTVAANGNLEIALAQGSVTEDIQAPTESAVGDSSANPDKGIVLSNITWGNLINVSDPSYGLDKIALRPALLNDHDKFRTPLKGATYGMDGRVIDTQETFEFSSYGEIEGSDGLHQFFAGDKVKYGVRAVSSVGYSDEGSNSLAESALRTASGHYQNAQNHYAALVSDGKGQKPQPMELIEGSGQTCITALQSLVAVFAQDKVNEYGLGGSSSGDSDCGPHLKYVYRMMEELMVVLEHEGNALLTLANWQVYAQNEGMSLKTFGSIDELLGASSTTLNNYKIDLTTLAGFKKNWNDLKSCIEKMAPMVEKAKNEKVIWDEIANIVAPLVNISTTEIDGIPMNKITADNAMSVLRAKKVEVKDGLLKDVDLRTIPNNVNYRLNAAVSVSVQTILGKQTVNATVYTSAWGQEGTYTKDVSATSNLGAVNKGEATALDTYGIALDLWLRTNYPDAVLTLEGTTLYTSVNATINIGGTEYNLYTVKLGETPTEVYQKDDKWYYANTHQEIENEVIEAAEALPVQKQIDVVDGYQGENRIWEDWEAMTQAGLIEKDSTTQGAGSCFVFYANDPVEEAKITEMLQAFTVEFINQDGLSIGTAILNTQKAYANMGKVTIPLEVMIGTEYIDADGETKTGLMPLEQNKATWITALIYLDGAQLKNENVLSAGELNGQLNIQFGTNAALLAPEDEQLQAQYRTITAKVAIAGTETTNELVSLEYNPDGYPTEITLNVEGEQPSRITGFFVRTINSTQGSRGEEINFTPNGDGTWTGKFTEDDEGEWTVPFALTHPGTYVFNTLLVDGVQYTLHDGSDPEFEANHPKIYIEGLALGEVTTDDPPGAYMTPDSSKDIKVTAKIDAAVAPTTVTAQFFSTDNSEQFTTTLTYNSITDEWVGTVKISTSGNYELKFISVDGQALPVPSQGTYTLKLGISARINTTVPEKDRNWVYDPQAEPVQLEMQVEIIDNAKQPIGNLTGAKLYYKNITNPAGLQWNSNGYYEGEMSPTTPGIFTFEKLVLPNNMGEVKGAYNAPEFSAVSPEPPSYVGSLTSDTQYVLQSTKDAYILAQTMNAEAATVWAEVTTPSGRKVVLSGQHGSDANTIEFALRNASGAKEDGIWTLNRLFFQNVFDKETGTWYGISGTATEENSYVIDATDAPGIANVKTEVIANPYVKVFYDGTEQKSQLTGQSAVKLGGENATFMTEHELKSLSVEIADYKGNPIPDLKAVYWNIIHNENSMEANGGYTGPGYGTNNHQLNLKAGSDTEYVAETQKLSVAGTYTTTVTTFFDWNGNGNQDAGEVDTWWKADYTVTSKKPTATVTAITPTGSNAAEITYTTKSLGWRGTEPTFTATGNQTSQIVTATNTATVYAVATADNSTQRHGSFTRPTLTITVGGSHSDYTASMTLPAGAASEIIFSGTGNAAIKKTLGSVSQIKSWTSNFILTHTLDAYYGHGDQTITTMTLTKGTKTYTVTLTNPIVIKNPSSVNH